jgi:hypothetical protein
LDSPPQALVSNSSLAPNKDEDASFELMTAESDIDPEDGISGLSYRIPRRLLQELRESKKIVYWSHTFYRNGKDEPIKVSYASNLRESEELAKRFLKEKVLGFDS